MIILYFDIIVKIMFHIIVIGAASNPVSSGQLPFVKDIKEWISAFPDSHFYFIDPMHKNDQDMFLLYKKAGISFTIIMEPFKFKDYEPDNTDQYLFIDYAQFIISEREFQKHYGLQYYYWCPGCSGERLIPLFALEQARKIPKYSLTNDPITNSLPFRYREQIVIEMNEHSMIVRLADNPPSWIIMKYQNMENYKVMVDTSRDILYKWFKVNGKDLEDITPDKWYYEIRKIAFL